MSANQNKNVIEQLFNECFGKANFALLDQFISPDYVNYTFPSPSKGPQGIITVIENFYNAFPDMKINLEEVIGENDTVATRGYWTGTNDGSFMGMPPTGKKVKIGFMDFWKFRDGKATENWVQMDLAGLMQQLQASPQPTAETVEA